MPDDLVPLVRFAPVRRRVPDRPYPGAAMTWLLVVPAILILAVVLLVWYVQSFASRPSTPLDERLDRADIEEDERERLAREYRRGPRGWTF